tara:strand:+ start:490 stop:693 length:204 start_codon:yes stop_codon:yes gene_type:complete
MVIPSVDKEVLKKSSRKEKYIPIGSMFFTMKVAFDSSKFSFLVPPAEERSALSLSLSPTPAKINVVV